MTRRYSLLIAIILCAALPAMSAYTLYLITQNPTFRPLGLTHEKLALMGGRQRTAAIVIRVNWGTGYPDRAGQKRLKREIADTLAAYTDSYVFDFNEIAGSDVTVTFSVGPNSYGPFPPDRLIEGIRPALVALEVTARSRG